jgi:hypothetical protein
MVLGLEVVALAAVPAVAHAVPAAASVAEVVAGCTPLAAAALVAAPVPT